MEIMLQVVLAAMGVLTAQAAAVVVDMQAAVAARFRVAAAAAIM